MAGGRKVVFCPKKKTKAAQNNVCAQYLPNFEKSGFIEIAFMVQK